MSNRTFLDVFAHRVERTPELAALATVDVGRHEVMTWAEVDRQSHLLAHGLLSLGLEKDTPIGLISRNQPEWVVSDLAIQKAACCTVPMAAELAVDQVGTILVESGARVVVLENEKLLARLRRILSGTPVEHVLVMAGPTQLPTEIRWEEWLAAGRLHHAEHPDALRERMAGLLGSDLASIVYTTGTTGRPKGVKLTHASFAFEAEAIAGVLREFVAPEDLHLLEVPLAHILGRTTFMAAVGLGFCTALTRGTEPLETVLARARPTLATVFPVQLERTYAAFSHDLAQKDGLSRRLHDWALGVGGRVASSRGQRNPLNPGLMLGHLLSRSLILDPLVKERFGGRLRYLICGGSSLFLEIAEFFNSLGVLVLEGYGLTENAGAANVNRPDRFRFGTVGPPLPGVEEKITREGEICIRGPNVMAGYLGEPWPDPGVIDEEGWLHTGDLGTLDAEGFLRVTGRRQDVIHTTAGHRISPQHIEKLLRTSPFIDQALVLGDGRPFLTALISLNPEPVLKVGEEESLAFDRLADLLVHPRVREIVEREIEERNRLLSGHEIIRKFAILPAPSPVDSGEWNAALRLNRREVLERHRDLIESLYEGSG